MVGQIPKAHQMKTLYDRSHQRRIEIKYTVLKETGKVRPV
jgi:hypothetical protein